MKKLATTMLSLVTMLALVSTGLAAETADKLGEATITINKTWENEVNESSRPEIVTVNVGDQSVTLSAENNWTATVVVDAYAEDGSLRSYEISEEPVADYTSVVDPATVVMQGFGDVNDLISIRQCNTTTQYFADNNMAVFKKGNAFVIWTANELTAGAKIAFVALIESYAIDDLLDLGTPDFVYGYNMFDLNGQNVTITEDGYIEFEGRSGWSWFYTGNVALAQDNYNVNVTNTYVPPLVWEQYSADTGTGYDPNGQIRDDNWFMYNTINVADWEIGDSATFDIQAGQWKNETNFVGTYTLLKNADGLFEIYYDVNSNYFADREDADYYKLQFDSVNLWVNDTGSFQVSPGNQDGLATAVTAGNAFSVDSDILYIYAHFDVSYWHLVPIN